MKDQYSERLLNRIFLAAALTFTFWTVTDSLGEYQVADFLTTFRRISEFLSDYKRVVINNGSHASFLLVGSLGRVLKFFLGSVYQPGDVVTPWLRMTTTLPFVLAQVIVSLGVVFVIAKVLVSLLGVSGKRRWFLGFMVGFLLIHLPWLRALVKILKYDSLSILLATLGLALYLNFFVSQRARKFDLALTFFVFGAAFIEKETSVSVLTFVFFAQTFWIFMSADTLKVKLRDFATLSLLAGGALFFAFWALIPKLWLHPKGVWELFTYFSTTLSMLRLNIFIFLLSVLILIHYLRGAVIRLVSSRVLLNTVKWGLFLFFIAVFALSVIDQRNPFTLLSYMSDAEKTQLLARGIVFSPDMAGVQLTTMSTSLIWTRLIFFLGYWKIIFYTLPEIFVFSLVVSPLVLELMTPAIWGPVCILLAGVFYHLAAYAYLLAPMDAKYLTQLMVFCVLIFAIFMIEILRSRTHYRYKAALIWGIFFFNFYGAVSLAPSSLGYLNVWRSRDVESKDFLTPHNFASWTWAGWGEQSWAAFNFLERLGSQHSSVVVDYALPFRPYPGIRLDRVSGNVRLGEERDMKSLCLSLKDRIDGGTEYLLISKNTAYRYFGARELVSRFSQDTVFKESRMGVDYAWMFKVASLKNALQDECNFP